MADIRITPASSVMAFTSSLNYKQTLTQDASGTIVLQGSGSINRTNLFAVDGNNGRLFSIDDDLSDSLFSVNTIAGLPVMEAFANNTVVLGTYGQNVLVVTGSKVGIGTASPTGKLHTALPTLTNEDTDSEHAIFGSGTSGNGVRIGYSESNNYGVVNALKPGVAWSNLHIGGANLLLRTNGTERLRVDSNGNVGIGTTSPEQKLSVNGNIQIAGISGTTRYILTNEFSGGTGRLVFQAGQGSSAYGGALNLYANSHVTSPGDVVVGLSANGVSKFRVNSSGLDGGADLMTVLYSGNVGIGTTSPNAKLDVNGNVVISGSLTVSGSTVVTGSVRGQVTTLTNGLITASIDLSTNNFFSLGLADGLTTHISASNIQPGQTANIRIIQGSGGTGKVSFNSVIKSGSFYTGSAIANAVDIVTFISFDSSTIYMSAVTNLK